MDFKRVLVIGAGQMGSGIAQVMAQGGLEVVLRDSRKSLFVKGLPVSRRIWPKVLKREK